MMHGESIELLRKEIDKLSEDRKLINAKLDRLEDELKNDGSIMAITYVPIKRDLLSVEEDLAFKIAEHESAIEALLNDEV